MNFIEQIRILPFTLILIKFIILFLYFEHLIKKLLILQISKKIGIL